MFEIKEEIEHYRAIRENADNAFRRIEFQNSAMAWKVWAHSLLGGLLMGVLAMSMFFVWDYRSSKKVRETAAKWEVLRDIDPPLSQKLEGLVEKYRKQLKKP